MGKLLLDNRIRMDPYYFRSRIQTRIKDEIQKLFRFKIELWKAVGAHNAGVEVEIWAVKGLKTSGRRFASLMRSLI
jgi:hypothetical protein